jgi:hypothetical protein
MLVNSSDPTNAVWTKDPQIEITAGAADPTGGNNAVLVTNAGNATRTLSQQLKVPANYQYCFSLYVVSVQPTTLTLFRQGTNTAANEDIAVSNSWRRVVSSGRLNDAGAQFNVGVNLAPGQQVTLFGLQLEAQIQPSRYRPTLASGGVYANCHFMSPTLPITSHAPNLFSTAFAIQTNI